MITIAPFLPEHLFQISLQAGQKDSIDQLAASYGDGLVEAGNCFTALSDGNPLLCGGIIEQWEGRGLAWALVDARAGRAFVPISKSVKRCVDVYLATKFRRIEMHVDCNFAQAIRWAELLGFKVESKMPNFTPDGRDAFMFVRFK